MNVIDIILIIPIVWAMYTGFRNGFMVQLTGMAGVVAGIWLGFRFGNVVGGWLDLGGDTAKVIGFVVVVILVLVGCAILGRLLGGLLKFAGLGMLDTVGGMLLSTLKMLLIVSVVVVCFDIANNSWHMVRRSRLSSSRLYAPVMQFSQSLLPVVGNVRTSLFDDNTPRQ